MKRLTSLIAATAWIILTASSCSHLQTDYPRQASTAFTAPASTTMGALFEREAAAHPGRSGFVVLDEHRDAFTARVALADFAEKTLDIQYFIWASDTIGQMIGERIIKAAERGVRVRFLLDDIYFKKRDSAAAALAAHPNIEIRIFNPHKARRFRTVELLANFGRLNKRMHNKVMCMDNTCVIVGGRNIADEYFGLSEGYNNRDLDIAAIGPIVREVSHTFDEFWNSPAAIPIEALVREDHDLEDFRRQIETSHQTLDRSRYPYPLDVDLAELRSKLTSVGSDATWAPAHVIHDEFSSMIKGRAGDTVADQLAENFLKTENELLIESAYFVVNKQGIEFTRKMTDRGVQVRVLTNSLASNNVMAAQAGHSKKRKKLLDAGLELYELRPDADAVLSQVAPRCRQAISTLHTKALVIDENKAFVGSFNLDPRSANINSEIGIMVESADFAQQVKAFLDKGVRAENSYRVTGSGRKRETWKTTVDDEIRTWRVDPETSWFKRLKARLIEWLPIDSQL